MELPPPTSRPDTSTTTEYVNSLRPNATLWNEWAKLDAETAYWAKVYYRNLAEATIEVVVERDYHDLPVADWRDSKSARPATVDLFRGEEPPYSDVEA